MRPFMVFHDPVFLLIFLPIALCGFALIGRTRRHRAALAWLSLASLAFYAYGGKTDTVLLAASMVFNFLVAGVLQRCVETRGESAAEGWLAFGVLTNLGLLGVYKYADFVAWNIGSVFGVSAGALGVVLPLAISFFTLQQIAFLVDVRRGVASVPSFVTYLLFVSYFPHLIAGPIVRYRDLVPQFLAHPLRLRADDLVDGLSVVLLGVFKKAVLADALGSYADPVFGAVDAGTQVSLFEAWLAAMAFSFEIYFDFSGYSDMAVGLARMFSIRLPINFNSPYRAPSIIEFWRRWHMTLSVFLRDYVYIPIGGNRRGPIARYRNLLLTMLIGGLWHGAAWNFVLWGTMHGVLLALNHAWRATFGRRLPEAVVRNGLWRVACALLTFAIVTIAWVLFRAQTVDGAGRMLIAMTGTYGTYLPKAVLDTVPWLGLVAEARGSLPLLADGTVLGLGEAFLLLALSAAIVATPINLVTMPLGARLLLLVPTLGFSINAVFYRTTSEFIYFRF